MTVFRHPDTVSGAGIVALGIGAMILLRGPAAEQPGPIGPATFPLLISALLAVSGAGIVARSFFAEPVTLERLRLWPLAAVAGAALLFSTLAEPLGLVPIVALIVVLLGLIVRPFRSIETAVLAAALAAFCHAIFLVFLALPMPAFGSLFGG